VGGRNRLNINEFASESAVAEHPNDYFSIFDAIVSSDDVHYTPQSKVETYLDVLGLLNMRGFLLETGVLQSLDASLAVHASSPKLEAYFRYYDQLEIPSVDNEVKCASWVLWQNQRVCDLKTLGQLTSGPQLANETSA
jgi:UDP-glucose:glycoprotein glucosyltransferase